MIMTVGADILTMVTTQQAIFLSGMKAPPALAAAVVVSRSLRRFRIPVDAAATVGLHRTLPELAEIKVISLIKPEVLAKYTTGNSFYARTGKSVTDFLAKYGACYLVASRWCGAAAALAIFGALHADVLGLGTSLKEVSWLDDKDKEKLDKIGNIAGSGGLALILSAIPFPFVFVGSLVKGVPHLHRIRTGLLAKSKGQ